MVSTTPTMSDAELARSMMPWVFADYANVAAYSLIELGWKVGRETPTPPPNNVVKEKVRRNITALRSRKRPMLP